LSLFNFITINFTSDFLW